MLEGIFENNILVAPWPVYVGEKFFSGSKVTKLIHCNVKCVQGLEGDRIQNCEHGLSHISKTYKGTRFIVSGVYIYSSPENKKLNKKYKSQKASLVHIQKWMIETEDKFNSITHISTKLAKGRFDQFHEFAKWANEINFYSNRLVEKSKSSKEAGFSAASEDLKSLFKTSVMLLDALDTSSIYFNPSSASFGNKRSTDIYSLVHKISAVLGHSKANKSRVNIPLRGRVEHRHHVYESFKIIPLSFIQNAIKYSKVKNVEIVFQEIEKMLSMSVISYGDLIPENEIPQLFERGFRSVSAKRCGLEGNGLGLYVARIVSDAHKFKLSAKSELDGKYQNLAKNTFTIDIH